jgi:transposase
VFQEGINTIDDAAQRLQRLEAQVAAIVPTWSLAPLVQAYQAMRGASFLVAATYAASIHRGSSCRSWASVPSERSTGEHVRRQGLTLAGNRRARRALIEAAWTYRYPARVSETLQPRLKGAPRRKHGMR